MQTSKLSRTELFEQAPIPRALAAMAVPTIISQLINLIYNMVDAFFIGRTGNSYMMAATRLALIPTRIPGRSQARPPARSSSASSAGRTLAGS